MQSTDKVAGATSEATEVASSATNQVAYAVDPEKVKAKVEASREARQRLEEREQSGNPNAQVLDPHETRVEPRYIIVQNRSDKVLIVPDLKNGPEDMGLMMLPGQIEVLTDFYSPQQINRSRGLRYAATKMEGYGSTMADPKYALVPLKSVDEGESFKAPERKKLPKGVEIEDESYNDFDLRFEELEARDAKREEKLLKKTLGMRVSKQHGASPVHV